MGSRKELQKLNYNHTLLRINSIQKKLNEPSIISIPIDGIYKSFVSEQITTRGESIMGVDKSESDEPTGSLDQKNQLN